jgi:hypothetical protein
VVQVQTKFWNVGMAVFCAAVTMSFVGGAYAQSCTAQLRNLESRIASAQASDPNMGICFSCRQLGSLMEDAIQLHEQCGPEIDPTGEQLQAYLNSYAGVQDCVRQFCSE